VGSVCVLCLGEFVFDMWGVSVCCVWESLLWFCRE